MYAVHYSAIPVVQSTVYTLPMQSVSEAGTHKFHLLQDLDININI